MRSRPSQTPSVACWREFFRANRYESAARSQIQRLARTLVVFSLSGTLGCATTGTYQYGRFPSERLATADASEVSVEYGQPNATLDRIGNILGAPAKFLALNSKIDNHQVSEQTVAKLTDYLEKNDITDVHVSVNDYSPKEQWKRLRENKRISPGWKYTAGTLSWMGYTIRPGRLFGGTKYNPFTNTLYVNSDVPAVLLVEAAYAKDIHSQRLPGTYAVFANGLPGVNVWRQTRAVSDVLGYAKAERDWEVEKETYRVLYPQIGATTFGGAGVLFTASPMSFSTFLIGPVLGASGAIAGHAAGRTISNRREAELKHIEDCDQVLVNAMQHSRSIEPEAEVKDLVTSQEVDEESRERNPVIQAGHDDSHASVAE